MKKYYVWEVWTGDGKYLGYFLENEKDHADMFARAYDGKVVKSVRFTEVYLKAVLTAMRANKQK